MSVVELHGFCGHKEVLDRLAQLCGILGSRSSTSITAFQWQAPVGPYSAGSGEHGGSRASGEDAKRGRRLQR